MQGKETTVCPFCRHTVVKGNFCTYCSKKLVKQCDCWVKKQKYNCGFSQCPGLKLELIRSAGEIAERDRRCDKHIKKIFINTPVNHKGTCDGLLNNQKVAGSNPAGATIAIDAFLSGMRFFIARGHRHACPIPATFPLPFLLFFNIFNIKA